MSSKLGSSGNSFSFCDVLLVLCNPILFDLDILECAFVVVPNDTVGVLVPCFFFANDTSVVFVFVFGFVFDELDVARIKGFSGASLCDSSGVVSSPSGCDIVSIVD